MALCIFRGGSFTSFADDTQEKSLCGQVPTFAEEFFKLP